MTKVTLRQKPISGGKYSLYLDFYPAIPHPDTGKQTRREFLGLYVFDKPKNPAEKQQNKETKALAEHIRAKRQIEIQSGQYGFLSRNNQTTDFIVYFKGMAVSRMESNRENWNSVLYYIEKFFGTSYMITNLNEKVIMEFRNFLLTVPSQHQNGKPLARNSAVSYFNKFKACLKQAYKEGILTIDLNARIESIKQEETVREYLTLEELQRLAETECSLPILKQASLFSALTGLRFSDIEKLLWSELRYSQDDGYYISFRQQKTKGVEYLPISQQAYQLLGDPKLPESRVFEGLEYSAYNNQILKNWILNAGITKKITFHSFRHTFAVLQLQFGTEIYTVSKMLGHRELKTTQVYAKIIDQTKREASERIKLNLNPKSIN